MSFENKKVKGTTTISAVVASIMNRLKDYSMRNYSFLEQIVIEGYTELNLWHLDNIEVVYLKMSEAKAVSLPCDFVDWTKIGIPINGKLRVITNHKKILLPRKFPDGEPVGNTDSGETSDVNIYFIDHIRSDQYMGGLYGVPGGVDKVYYRFDRENRQLVFSGAAPRSEIVLEYISSGVNLEGGTIIPIEAVPALRAYALWQNIENDRKTPLNEKERKKSQYEEEVEKLRFFQSSFTADEYKRHVFKHARQSAKR